MTGYCRIRRRRLDSFSIRSCKAKGSRLRSGTRKLIRSLLDGPYILFSGRTRGAPGAAFDAAVAPARRRTEIWHPDKRRLPADAFRRRIHRSPQDSREAVAAGCDRRCELTRHCAIGPPASPRRRPARNLACLLAARAAARWGPARGRTNRGHDAI